MIATTREVMLTTIDNPYDPFDEFFLWDQCDRELGYNTTSYIARLVRFTEDMTQEEENAEVERVIDEIMEFNPLAPLFKKLVRNTN